MGKISKIIKIFLIYLFLLICNGNIIVKADTSGAYFDYISYYQENNINEIDCFGNNVLNPVVKLNAKETTEISLTIKDELKNSRTIFYNGDFTNAREIEISIKSKYKSFYLEVLDSNEETIKISSSNVIKISNLPNGEYYFIGKCYGESYQNNNVYVGYYTVCKLRFNIDCSSPTILGASSEKNKYVNTNSVNIKALDAGCGVDSLYMKKPTDSQFNRVGASVVLTNLEEGLYEFYAKDKIGNTSNKYYLIYDSKGPTGQFINLNNETITSECSNAAFKFESTDNGSGVSYSEYKNPYQEEWIKYDGRIIEDLIEGVYQFRSVDACGNISEIYSMRIDKTRPKILSYGNDMQLSNNQNVSCDNIYFEVLDETGVAGVYIKLPDSNIFVNYEIGKKYSLNGKYTLYAYDYAGNRSDTFNIFLDNEPPMILSSPDKLNSSTSNIVEIICTDLSECMLYFKTPSMNKFVPHDSLCYVIGKKQESGKYYFYADDILGNKSDIYWIDKIDNTPIINIVRDYEKNTVYIDWENDNYLVTLNGSSYLKKTIIKEEDIYKVIVTEEGVGEYETGFVIDHLYKLIESKKASCEEQGYKRYKCISCGDTYDDDLEKALGHSYEEIYREPTCINEGIKSKICINCGYEEESILPKKQHQYILIGEKIVGNVKEREYECEICRDRYIEKIGDIWDKIIDFIDYLLDKYFEKIIWIILSLTGIWSIALGIMIIVSKKEDDKEKAIRYLRTYIISLILIFIIFLACPLLMRGFIYLIT